MRLFAGAQALAHKVQGLVRQPPSLDPRLRVRQSAGSFTQLVLGDLLGGGRGLGLPVPGPSSRRKEHARRDKADVLSNRTSRGRRGRGFKGSRLEDSDLSSPESSNPPSPPASQSFMSSSNRSSSSGTVCIGMECASAEPVGPSLPAALLGEVVVGAAPTAAAAPAAPLSSISGSASATALWGLLQPKGTADGGEEKPQEDSSLLFDLD